MRPLIASLLLLLTVAAPAAAKSYSAERFDSRIRVLPGGAIEVVETVVFRFEEGTFDHVFREISKRRTDGIEIVSAAMDGRTLAFGEESGQVEVSGGSPVKVRWRFAPRSDSTHTFVLTYVARGVVRREGGVDLLEWVALPTQHAYRIDSSEVVLETPAPLSANPVLESRRVADAGIEPSGQRVQILARGIGKNGWVKARLQFAEGSVIASAPRWQQRELTANAFAPRWAAACGIVFAMGLVLLFALRQGYDSPTRGTATLAVDTPPDSLRPALAGAVASNGGVALQHAMATLFALADRGVITITEEPRKWRQRHFTLHRRQTGDATTPEEAALLNLAFRNKDREEESVPLSQARSRVTNRLRDFRKAVQQDLRAHGLLDEDRMHVRSRYLGFSIALLILALMLIVPAVFLARKYQGWPFLIAAAVGAVAIIGFIFYGALTPLSNEGVRRAERWRAYQKYLKDVARERVHLTAESPALVLPFAVALGLAGVWSKYVKHHPTMVPPWFRALATTADDGGFAAFIAAGGAAGDGGAASAGATGGAAGGGASGAG